MGQQLLLARERKGWSQQQAASELGVSQTYLSFLENGKRRVPEDFARKARDVYGLSAVVLPLESNPDNVPTTSEDDLEVGLAALGYPGFSYREAKHPKNPAEVLVSALKAENLDSRLTEALPWVVLKFPDLDWKWVFKAAKLNDLQNRLGFVVCVARKLAERRGEADRAALLVEQERMLEESRLVREDTLCHASLTEAERTWLRESRPEEAKFWSLLTDLSPEHLAYAN